MMGAPIDNFEKYMYSYCTILFLGTQWSHSCAIVHEVKASDPDTSPYDVGRVGGNCRASLMHGNSAHLSRSSQHFLVFSILFG